MRLSTGSGFRLFSLTKELCEGADANDSREIIGVAGIAI